MESELSLIKDGVSTYIPWNSSEKEISFSPIYLLFTYFFISIWTHGSLYFGFKSNTALFFLLKLFQLWPLGALSVGSWVLLISIHYCRVFYFLSNSLLSGTTRYPRLPCISCPFLESAISPRSPGSFD